jgi:hypothetical protein
MWEIVSVYAHFQRVTLGCVTQYWAVFEPFGESLVRASGAIMLAFLKDVGHVYFDLQHDHREYSFPVPRRDVGAIAPPAIGVIEVRSEDALPWPGINRECRSWVWEHFE